MVSGDTIELLKECDAGIKMGIRAIDEVMDRVDNHNLENILQNSKEKHETIEDEIKELLNSYGDSGKDPSAMAKGTFSIFASVCASSVFPEPVGPIKSTLLF